MISKTEWLVHFAGLYIAYQMEIMWAGAYIFNIFQVDVVATIFKKMDLNVPSH